MKALNEDRISLPSGLRKSRGPNVPYLIGGTAEFVAEVREEQAQRGRNPVTQR